MRSAFQARTGILLALVLAFAGCGDNGDGDGEGGDSPEDVVARARTALDTRDFGAVVGLMVPDERPMMTLALVFGVSMMPQMLKMGEAMAQTEEAKQEVRDKVDALQAEIDAALAKHGLNDLEPPDDAMRDADAARAYADKHLSKVDHRAAMADLMAVFDRFGDEDGGAPTTKIFKGTLTDVKVDGDRATGTIDGDEITFMKIDGRWYASLVGGRR